MHDVNCKVKQSLKLSWVVDNVCTINPISVEKCFYNVCDAPQQLVLKKGAMGHAGQVF